MTFDDYQAQTHYTNLYPEERYIRFYDVIKTGPYAHMTFEQKFWSKVNITTQGECWIYRGKIFKNGYGCFPIQSLNFLSHRVAYFLCYKDIPPSLMHTCDNRVCCNPFHLKIGSQKENIQDMIKKGRSNPPKERRNHRCKLLNHEIVTIKDLLQSGLFLQREIAERYNVRPNHISRINTGSRRATI